MDKCNIVGWLIYAEAEARRNRHYIDLYFAECQRRDISLSLLLAEHLSPCVRDGKPCLLAQGQLLPAPAFAICRTPWPLLSHHMQAMGIPVFNSAQVSEVCNHKMRTYLHMAAHGVPVMDTTYAPRGPQAAAYPFVVKPVRGHGGQHVFLVQNDEQLARARAELQNTPCVQQAVASDLGRDVRVYVMGGRILAAMLRTAQDDFRSNFSLGGQARPYTLDVSQQALVRKVISLFDFDFVGIDFVFHEGELVLNEIEDVVGARMLYAHTNIDVVGEYLTHILQKLGLSK